MRLFTLGMVLIVVSSAWAQMPAGKNAAAAPGIPPSTALSLNPELAAKAEAFLREYYGWGKDIQVQFLATKDAPIAGLYDVRLQLTANGNTQAGDLYITKDGKFIIQGTIIAIAPHPFADNLKLLATTDSPTQGPAGAKVTVVEFSDYQCPHCRAFAEALKTLQPRFPQVRWVFKNYPLEKIHPWAMAAAIAGRCAYKSSNDAFWKLNDTIFQNQDTIKAETAQDQLKAYAATAGAAADAYAVCLNDPTTKAAVDADISEGDALQVQSTPTVFVNGRPVIGGDPQLVANFIQYEIETEAAQHQ
jgi:protein-disulfide isomerase